MGTSKYTLLYLQTYIIFGTEVAGGTQTSVFFGHLGHPPAFTHSYMNAFLAASHSASKLPPSTASLTGILYKKP